MEQLKINTVLPSIAVSEITKVFEPQPRVAFKTQGKGRDMENVIMVTFDVESQAYQAFSQLKNDSVNSAYSILQMAVIKEEGGKITAKDSFDSGIDSTDDTWKGGLIGGLVGILGGPFGVLLGASFGLLAGSIMDSNDVADNSSMLLYSSKELKDGKTAIIALVQETDEKAFDLRLQSYDCTITRWDAAEIADDVEQAEQEQKQLAKEAREKVRAQKKADREKAREEKRQAIRKKFDDMKQNVAK